MFRCELLVFAGCNFSESIAFGKNPWNFIRLQEPSISSCLEAHLSQNKSTLILLMVRSEIQRSPPVDICIVVVSHYLQGYKTHHPTRWLYLVTLVTFCFASTTVTPNRSNGNDDLFSRHMSQLRSAGVMKDVLEVPCFISPRWSLCSRCVYGRYIPWRIGLIHGTRGFWYIYLHSYHKNQRNPWIGKYTWMLWVWFWLFCDPNNLMPSPDSTQEPCSAIRNSKQPPWDGAKSPVNQ